MGGESRHPVARDLESTDVGAGAASPRPFSPLHVRAPRRGARRTVKILFVAANARAGEPLALDEEYRAIEQALRMARYRDAFQLIPQLATRPADLQRAMLEHSPDVVHFACHGSARAEVLLLGDGPTSSAVSAEVLASLFEVLRDNVALVVFNACFASGQAWRIGQSGGIAIGMRERIEDRVAIAFASALYSALAYGRSVQDAFDLGAAAVAMADARHRGIAQLFGGPGVDAHAVRLVERSPGIIRLRRVALTAGLALAGLAWAWSVPGGDGAPTQPAARRAGLSPRDPGMVRFAEASIRPDEVSAVQASAGCEAPDIARDCAGPSVGTVMLQAFDLDVLEVTNGEYASWLMQHPDLWRLAPTGVIRARKDPELSFVLISEKCGGGLIVDSAQHVVADRERSAWPVVCVTWHGASEYCRAQRKRLPLDAEWQLAAGVGHRRFPWGNDPPRNDSVTFERRDSASPHPRAVGGSTQDISPDGVRDLGGNVAEWIEDDRGSSHSKMIRGGSWASHQCNVQGASCKRVELRGFGPYGPDVGFRCAASVIRDPREAR